MNHSDQANNLFGDTHHKFSFNEHNSSALSQNGLCNSDIMAKSFDQTYAVKPPSPFVMGTADDPFGGDYFDTPNAASQQKEQNIYEADNSDNEEEDEVDNEDEADNEQGEESFNDSSPPDGVIKGFQVEDVKFDRYSTTAHRYFPAKYTFPDTLNSLYQFTTERNNRIQEENKAIIAAFGSRSDAEHRESVKKIFDALVELEQVIDKPTVSGPAQAVTCLQRKAYSAKKLETISWEIYVSVLC